MLMLINDCIIIIYVHKSIKLKNTIPLNIEFQIFIINMKVWPQIL